MTSLPGRRFRFAGEQIEVALIAAGIDLAVLNGRPDRTAQFVRVGAVLARELGAELDVVLSRKLHGPTQPELAIGAVSEDGQVYLNHQAEEVPGVTDEYPARERQHQLDEIARRQKLFRAVRPSARIGGRSVIVTDDGIATGSTMIAALPLIRSQKPHELIVAVPVGPPERLRAIRARCDRVVCLLAPQRFWAIGQFYEDFEQVDDQQVVDLLRECVRAPHTAGAS